MKLKLIMKNGFKFTGELIKETETHWTLNDIKDGEVEILKSEVAIKSVVVE